MIADLREPNIAKWQWKFDDGELSGPNLDKTTIIYLFGDLFMHKNS